MNKRLAALPLAVLATFGPAQAQATHSQRFHGNGVAAPTLDRVVIRLDAPARPVDVGAGDLTLEFWPTAPVTWPSPAASPAASSASSWTAYLTGRPPDPPATSATSMAGRLPTPTIPSSADGFEG